MIAVIRTEGMDDYKLIINDVMLKLRTFRSGRYYVLKRSSIILNKIMFNIIYLLTNIKMKTVTMPCLLLLRKLILLFISFPYVFF